MFTQESKTLPVMKDLNFETATATVLWPLMSDEKIASLGLLDAFFSLLSSEGKNAKDNATVLHSVFGVVGTLVRSVGLESVTIPWIKYRGDTLVPVYGVMKMTASDFVDSLSAINKLL